MIDGVNCCHCGDAETVLVEVRRLVKREDGVNEWVQGVMCGPCLSEQHGEKVAPCAKHPTTGRPDVTLSDGGAVATGKATAAGKAVK